MKMLPLITLSALLGACAPSTALYVPTEAETEQCLAQGGTIEPAYALDAYVCLLPDRGRTAPP